MVQEVFQFIGGLFSDGAATLSFAIGTAAVAVTLKLAERLTIKDVFNWVGSLFKRK